MDVPEEILNAVSDRISREIGIRFTSSHHQDMIRGISDASQSLGFSRPIDCMHWLINAPLDKEQVKLLASFLTIGETYFFREKSSFVALEENILPGLIEQRRGSNRKITIWSAACCTGEEPYSIAISLYRILPDRSSWKIKILATDINTHYLAKANRAIYGEWSFRDVPENIKSIYFKKTQENSFELTTEIKQMVHFEPLNLVDEGFPLGLYTGEKVDIIFCRNVLMYFDPEKQRQVLNKFNTVMSDGGWLVPGLTEISGIFMSTFFPKQYPGAVIFQKISSSRENPCKPFIWNSDIQSKERIEKWFLQDVTANKDESFNDKDIELKTVESPNLAVKPTPELPAFKLNGENPGNGVHSSKSANNQHTRNFLSSHQTDVDFAEMNRITPRPAFEQINKARQMFERGHYEEVIRYLQKPDVTSNPPVENCLLLAKSNANLGQLSEADKYVKMALSLDGLNPQVHYLHASIQQELGKDEEAITSLQKAQYLNPNFILVHVAMAQIALRKGIPSAAQKHFKNALGLLRKMDPNEIVPESEGLTANLMIDMVQKIASYNSL